MRAFCSHFALTSARGLRRLGHAARTLATLTVALASLVPASAQITTTSANNLITAVLNGSGSFTCSLPALNNGFTIEGWVRPITHTGFSRIADIGSSDSQNVNLCVSQWTTGRPLLTINQGGTTVLWLEAPSSVPLSTWSHIAGVVNADRSAQLYVNGQLVASGTASALPPATAATVSYIGRARNNVDPILNGALADVRVWTTGRSQAQIQANMPVGSITGATTGLAAAYPFGSTGVAVLTDISGAGRNLTQSGTVTYEKSGTGTVTTQGLAGTSVLTVSDGTLNFNTTQTYTGGTLINGGTLQLAAGGVGTGLIRGDVTVASGARLLMSAANAFGWDTGVKVNAVTINGGLVENSAAGGNGWGITYRMSGGELRSAGGVGDLASHYSMGGGTTITTLASGSPATISGLVRLREGNPNNVLPIDVADGAASPDLVISASIEQVGAVVGITKTGAGLLALTGPASYAGTTTISAGTLQVGNGGTTGSLGSGNVVNNASLVFNRSDNISVANSISGTGSVTKNGAGSLFLNTTQTYTGGTVINAGALTLSGNYTGAGIIRGDVTVGPQGQLLLQDGVGLGWIAGSKVNTININGGLVYKTDLGGDGWGINYRMTGGELRANWGIFGSFPGSFFMMGGGSAITTLPSSTTALVSGSIRVREGNPNNALLFDVADGVASPDLLVTAGIADENGPNGITKTGAGLLAITGSPNLYSGTTTISAGTLQVGDGGSSGSLGSGNVVNNATLAYNLVGYATVPNVISGTGNFVKLASGTVEISGNNTYTGTTTVSAGTLQVGNGGTSGTLGSGNVVNNATLTFNRSDSPYVANAISGTGTLVQNGTGTVTFGNASPGGGTLVQRGTLRINGIRTHLGNITLQPGTFLLVDGHDSLGYDINPPWVTTVTVNEATVTMAGGPNQASSTDFILNGGRITGTMNWTLVSATPANNTASVSTLASATTSVIDADTMGISQQSVTFDVADGTANPDLRMSTVASGTGGLVKAGAGTMAVSGAHTYSGNTTISAGTLALTGSGSFDSSPTITVASGATLDTSGRTSALALGATQTLANSGGTALLRGNVTATSGTLSLVASATTPAFTVSSGTLTLGAASTVRVTVSGTALAAGTYKLVSKGTGGSVSGPDRLAVTVQGSGLASGQGAYAQVASGELFLRVVPTATITLGSLAQAYNGSARAASATTVPSGLAVSFTYNGSSTAPVTVGSYAVVATITNTNYVGTATGTLVVSKGLASISLGNLFQSYDGTARRVVAATEPAGLSWTATYNGSANAPTNLGIYNVVATISDANYMGFTNGVLNVKAGNPGSRPEPTAQPPAYLNHHGYLTDASGNPLGSPNPRNYDLIFRIFSVPTGGTSLWAERQVVTVDQGQYDAMLGEGMSQGVEPWPSLETVLASGTGTARYLEVTVRALGIGGSDVTLSPRVLLASQPYAFLARHARTAETLVDSNSIPVLSVSGTAVGIGVEQANATLDVGGVVTTTAFASEGNTTVNGRYAAASFTGGGTLPVGAIIVWTGGAPPDGWALCDGSTVQGRRTPDLRSRFVLGQGQGSGLTSRSVGQVGGAESYTLTEANFAAHRHVFDPPGTWADQTGGHDHSYQTHSVNRGSGIGGNWPAEWWHSRTRHTSRTISHSAHQHTLSFTAQSQGAGGGQPHPSMPPFYALSFIMRVR